jgi:hypothetical protein
MADEGEPRYQLTRDELVEQLRIQVGFIQRSSVAYDDGYEDEARRLATVTRVLVHDTRKSVSLLSQLGVKDALRYHDTTLRPPHGALLVSSSGLAIQRMTIGGPEGGGRYVPVGEDPSPERIRPPVPFHDWWTRPFQIANDDFTRKQIVLNVANQDGGAHVDPSLDAPYAGLTRTNFPGWTYTDAEGTESDFDGNVALACVRQVAYELRRTVQEQLLHLIDPDTAADQPLSPALLEGVGRNDPCPCGSGRKLKKCHGA